MEKILFLVPLNSISKKDLNNYSEIYPDVKFAFSNTDSLKTVLKEKMTSNIEIIAARANSAKIIKELLPHTKVIEIPISGYDVIRSFNAAKFHGKTIAIITTVSDIYGLNTFEKAFNIKILNYLSTPLDKIETIIIDAISKGAEVILGGALTCRAVEKLGFQSTTIQLGPESVHRTLKEIKNINESLEIEASRQGFINKLMDNIVEGVILLDQDQNVILVNSIAKGIMGLDTDRIIGTNIKDIISHMDSEDNFDVSKNVVSDGITSINDINVVFNKLPIKVDGKSYGSIITLHETNKIQKMENVIRSKIYTKSNITKYIFDDICGNSKALSSVVSVAKSYAKTNSNILISGETGTGKELFAQSIHNESYRKDGPFIAINCAALPDNLLESELFGYVEGAFTGAKKGGKIGVFEAAHGGSIFLDEISGMNYKNQSSLLRVVQEKYVVRLGSNDMIPVDVRIITASNQDLKKLMRENKFREDLYYRLNVLNLILPPLRARENDIILLMKMFLNSKLSKFKDEFVFQEEAIKLLKAYDWPGNIRELKNVSERIIATASTPIITKEFLEDKIELGNLSIIPFNTDNEENQYSLTEQMQIDEIVNTLKITNGNMTKAAELLDINRTTLWRRMNKYNLN